ncbi:MAG: N-acetyl-alpha-D-glucosaminyl L-malate deacetylase 1 [Gemmatimonadaceae bacterium]|nr:N-acetyl-alpha-D-glucosaminyl L-malate deacetylase 1 [Gemmatimonadaceae bacterium]
MQPPALDLLAIAAHPDDAELTVGGTLALAVRQGYRVGILDLTAGELGTRGTPELRREEALQAAKVLGVPWRETLGLPDAGIANSDESRRRLVAVLRATRPTIVLAPAPPPFGRHPDHRIAAELIRDAAFLSGLRNFDAGEEPHRPRKIVHSIAYREDGVKPTFVVDVSEVFDLKMMAVRCYESQFDGATQSGEVYPTGEPLLDVIGHQAAHYGSLIRVRYGEPFYTSETMRVDDVVALSVSTF